MDNSENKNFFKHVFNFEDESKADMLNIVQYSMISLIPVILLNKTMAKYVPEADDTKGSLEISAEIVIQTIVMFIGILIIHRIVTYLPTYSGVKYPEFNVVLIILAVLMITLSLQTKLGEKVGILFDRVTELWDPSSADADKKKKKGNVKVSQPLQQQQQQQQINMANPVNQALYNDGTSISALPVQTNFDQMYQKDDTPLVGAFEPVAANDGGVSAFGGW
jgi:hypothetical protein